MWQNLDLAISHAASAVRFGSGGRVGRLGARPERLLELYEFEGCPYCRKVREALSILDLSALIRPCPRGGPRFRAELAKRGGKPQFPYLVDPNTGTEMYESSAIVAYLFERYGDGRVPRALALGPLTDVSSMLASALRPGRGAFYRKARAPERPLSLYGCEASPRSRIVRELLCTLELPYRLHNVAKGSPRIRNFVRRAGRMELPFVADPNTESALFGVSEIREHLLTTYAL
jgi:glutathione S-transferase